MKISKVDHIIGVRGEWRESDHGSHVPLPLDASAVPDAVVDKVADVFMSYAGTNGGLLRTLIAALAAALGEEG